MYKTVQEFLNFLDLFSRLCDNFKLDFMGYRDSTNSYFQKRVSENPKLYLQLINKEEKDLYPLISRDHTLHQHGLHYRRFTDHGPASLKCSGPQLSGGSRDLRTGTGDWRIKISHEKSQ